ncbi:hypothetical protein GOM49_15060 [Clostridium bovifaecis]|uniref:Uncharacterized protein n=1 Tax=Clostridium bovifaecis TaxID=2184719 RepID=A0A6I6F6Z6_9CLOT|nr:hypothetical protein GOM49_15060 [Clostridium bovifaecis]
MSEKSQIIMMFCLTIISVIGIISAVICYSKGPVKFRLKAKSNSLTHNDGEFGIEVIKESEKNEGK